MASSTTRLGRGTTTSRTAFRFIKERIRSAAFAASSDDDGRGGGGNRALGRLTALIHEHDDATETPGLIPQEAFLDVLDATEVRLDEEEVEFLLSKFSVQAGRCQGWIRAWQFFDALELAAPADYRDPELEMVDQLPQPYRTITKVMEQDILDRAWDMLCERNPELLLKIGDELDAEYKVHPSCRLGDGDAPAPAAVANDASSGSAATAATGNSFIGSVTALRLDHFGKRLFVGNTDGRILVLDPHVDQPILAHPAFVDSPGGVCALSEPHGPLDAALIGTKENDSAQGASVRPLRIVAAGHAPRQATDNDGNPIPSENEEEDAPFRAGSVVKVLEMWPTDPLVTVAVELRTGVRVAAVDLSTDGAFLAVATEDGALAVYELPSDADLAAEGEGDDAAAEQPEAPEAEDEDRPPVRKTIVLTKPVMSVAAPPGSQEVGDGGGAATLTSSRPGTASSQKSGGKSADSRPATPAPVARPPVPICRTHFLCSRCGVETLWSPLPAVATTGIVVWREGSNICRKYALGAAISDNAEMKKRAAAAAAAAEAEGAEAEASKKPAKGKKGKAPPKEEAVEAAPPPTPDDNYLVAEWYLPAAVSAAALDPTTVVLALGLEDGSVVMWDLHIHTVRATLQKHQAAVTCVAFHEGNYLVTGSVDERVHVYDVAPPGDIARHAHKEHGQEQEQEQPPPSRNNQNGTAAAADKGVPAARLVGCRHDFKAPVCSVYCPRDCPMVLAQAADGSVRIYDLVNAELVGNMSVAVAGDDDDGTWSALTNEQLSAAKRAAESLWPLRDEDSSEVLPASAAAAASAKNDPGDAENDVGDPAAGPAAQAKDEARRARWVRRSRALLACSGDLVAAVVTAQRGVEMPPPPPSPAAAAPSDGEDEGGGGENGVVEVDIPRPPLCTNHIGVFTTWDIITELCPGIAAACGSSSGYDQRHVAKRLFAELNAGQRRDESFQLPGSPTRAQDLFAPGGLAQGAYGGGMGSSMEGGQQPSRPSASRTTSGNKPGGSSRGGRKNSTAGRVVGIAEGHESPPASIAFAAPTADNITDLAGTDLERKPRNIAGCRFQEPVHIVRQRLRVRHESREDRESRMLRRKSDLKQAMGIL